MSKKSAILVAAATVLAIVTVRELTVDPASWDPGNGVPNGQNPVRLGIGDTLSGPLPVEHFAQIVARPLFNPSRRPAPRAQEKTPPKPPPVRKEEGPGPSQRFVLVGVLLAGDRHGALLMEKQTGVTLKVLEGENLDEWRVKDISEDEITLLRGNAQVVIGFAKSDPSPINGIRK